jgi:tetratricopeptide (TPR) repeat protein
MALSPAPYLAPRHTIRGLLGALTVGALGALAGAGSVAADETPAPPGVPLQAPRRPASALPGPLSPEEARSLLSDVRVGLALQDRLATSLPPEGVERVFAQLLQADPDHKILRFLRARAQRGPAAATEMRTLAQERLGLPTSEGAQIGAAWFAVARREAELGLLDPAIEAAGFALRLDPRAPCFALLGWVHQRKGDGPRAIAAYAGALRLDPRQISSRIALTDLLLRAGRVEEALKVGKGTLLLAPRSALGHLYWGTALALSGNAADAQRAYQRSLRLAGTDPDAVAAISAALKRIDGQRLALDTLRRTHALHRTHRETAVQLTSLLVEIGRADEARQVAEAALAGQDGDARLWFLRGLAEDGANQARLAVASYQRAIKADPERSEYRFALAASWRRLGDAKQALAIYKQTAQRFPEERRARDLYARALIEAGQYPEAAAELEELVRLAPEEPDPCYLLAVVRGVHLGQLHEARTWMERWHQLGGKEPAGLDWLFQLRRENR